MNSIDFVTQLNGLFARGDTQRYPMLMAQKIVKYFKSYPPEVLAQLLDLISEEWASNFGPPNLGEILKIVKTYNEKVPFDRAITPVRAVKQIVESAEEYIQPKRLAAFYGAMGRIMKIKDRKARRELFEAEKERILNGQNNDQG